MKKTEINCTFDYDVAVIGGGPAGATFARLCADRRIIVLDQLNSDAVDKNGMKRGKCCGGLLAPDAQRQLALQGLTLPRDILVDPQIFAVRTIDLSSDAPERYYQRSYINISRARFDEWLRSFLPADVMVRGAAVQSISRLDQEGYSIIYRKEGRQHSFTARYVVGADGGYSLVRRTFFPDRKIRKYAAVQEWYQAENRSPFYGALFDAELTDCYGWLISKDNYMVLGGAFPPQEAVRRFEKLRNKLQKRGITFGAPLKREGCMVCRPNSAKPVLTGREGAFLVGEAAGFISPSSLEGISWALESGALLAGAMMGSPKDIHSRYHSATRPMRNRLMGKLLKSPFLYTPLIRRIILRTGVMSLPIM